MQLENGDTLTFFDSPGLLDFTEELSYIERIVQHSDLLLFLMDDSVGITAKEEHILEIIRKEKKQNQTFLIINKLDLKRKESETDLALADYHSLGFDTIIGISAKTERNLTEIHDAIKSYYTKRSKTKGIKKSDSSKQELDTSSTASKIAIL